MIKENQIDEIRCGFEILSSEFLEILVMAGYGIFTHKIASTIVYLFLFRILRDVFQGYHADTIWKCFLSRKKIVIKSTINIYCLINFYRRLFIKIK